jgi:hypothetical protein
MIHAWIATIALRIYRIRQELHRHVHSQHADSFV